MKNNQEPLASNKSSIWPDAFFKAFGYYLFERLLLTIVFYIFI